MRVWLSCWVVRSKIQRPRREREREVKRRRGRKGELGVSGETMRGKRGVLGIGVEVERTQRISVTGIWYLFSIWMYIDTYDS